MEKPSKDEYTAPEVADILDMNYQTVSKRMKSPYAKKRWGVEIVELPDGSIKRVVPEDKLELWKDEVDYRGRPVFREEK